MHSMTGYGTATGKVRRGRLYVEIKTVNHRYCEISLKLPPRMGALEALLRGFLQPRFQRGRVEIFVKELSPVFGPSELALDVDLARSYQQALRKLRKALRLTGPADPLALTGLGPFVQLQEPHGNYLNIWKGIERLAARAAAQAQRMRGREGNYLLRDQTRRLREFRGLLHKIEKRFHSRRDQRRKAAVQNGEDANHAVDRLDISEELTRLQSHVRQYASLLKKKEPVGRRLDFLIQEMHREMNTIGAKAADAPISGHIVEAKSLLETLREQVQNIV